MAGRVVIGRDDGRGAGEREQLVLRADEDAHPFGLLGAAEEIDHVAAGLQIVEQEAYPLEIGKHLEVFEQMRLATHDQLALAAVAARPAGEAGGDDLLCQRVELGLTFLEPALDLGPYFGKGAAADPRVEEIAG